MQEGLDLQPLMCPEKLAVRDGDLHQLPWLGARSERCAVLDADGKATCTLGKNEPWRSGVSGCESMTFISSLGARACEAWRFALGSMLLSRNTQSGPAYFESLTPTQRLEPKAHLRGVEGRAPLALYERLDAFLSGSREVRVGLLG